MKLLKCLALFAPLLWLGCSNPADGVPEAAVQAPEDSASGEAENGDAQTFAFGPEGSSIQFVGSKVTGSHDGGFNEFAGEFKVADGRLTDSGNKVVIDTASIWSDSDRLTRHLKSADFFDVEQHPKATFVSTAIAPGEPDSTVTGNLTLHGITKQISFPARIQVSEDAVTVESEFFLNRFDFDMKYAGKADDLIRKEVVLKLNVKATPGSADLGGGH